MKRIENYKSFTIVAWITVIIFSLFTYNLTLKLSEKIDQLIPTVENGVYDADTFIN